jgi:hypothetical protein
MKHRVQILLGIVIVSIATPVLARTSTKPKSDLNVPPPPPMVQIDAGTKKGAREFTDSVDCVETPCIITQHGAWKFAPEVVDHYLVRMGYVHEKVFRPIALFQESTTLEQKMAERLLNRYPNRKAINLMHMVESGSISTIYVYGLLLQNDITEGDLITISLISIADPTQTQDYFYRFHRTGAVPDFDITLLYPLNYYHPNPGEQVQGTFGGAAFSFSVGTHMDPRKKYNWFIKGLRALRTNLFLGVVTRKELTTVSTGTVTKDNADGFVGLGITLFEFLNAGYGVNMIRSPHTFFPFVGIEIKHVYEFFRSLKPDSHSRWVKYMKEEEKRPMASEPR